MVEQKPLMSLEHRTTKFWRFCEGPWLWGPLGVVGGAVAGGATQSRLLGWTFAIVWVLFSVGVIRVRPFDHKYRKYRFVLIPTVCLFIAGLVCGIWELIPKPQPAPRPVTAIDIAAEVKKILITSAAQTTSASSHPRGAPVEVLLIFKDSPLFTPERKRRITAEINGFYLYLKGIGFPVETGIPPLGVSPYDVQMMGGTFPGSIYDQQIYFPKNSLDDSDAIRRVYASYVFRTLFHTMGGVTVPSIADETTATLFEEYYASSLVGRNLDKGDWKGHKWIEALWDIRQKKGKDFTDRVMYYTYQTWKPIPGDFDNTFLTRFLAGVWVIDNNGDSFKDVQSILTKHHVT
jgi:hypothetical protein